MPETAPIMLAVSSDLEGLLAKPVIRVIAPPEAEGRNIGIFLTDRQVLGHLVYVNTWSRLTEICWEVELGGVDELMEQKSIGWSFESEQADWLCGDVDQIAKVPGVEVRMYPEGYTQLSRDERRTYTLEHIRPQFYRSHPQFRLSMDSIHELGHYSAFWDGVDMKMADDVGRAQGGILYYNQVDLFRRRDD